MITVHKRLPRCTAPLLFIFLTAAALSLVGCDDDSGFRPPAVVGTISLTPDSAAVKPGGQVTFTAEIEGLEDESLIWSVNGHPGGDAACGTISTEGLYTAPSVMPGEPQAVVRASSAADSAVYGEALVTIIGLLLKPPSAAAGPGEQIAFTAEFSGLEVQPVTWSVNGIPGGSAELGTIDASGLYTAPGIAPSPRTVTVGVKSETDDTLEASAPVTVLTLELLPVEFTIGAGQSVSFDAVVHGLEDAQVSWYVDGDPGGNTVAGTIDSDGLYTAPVMIFEEFSATITAECTDHPTAYADATVTVVMPVKVELEDFVSYIDLGGDQFGIRIVTCGAASDGRAVDGFDIVGETLAYEVSFDLEGYYGGVLQAAALKDQVNEITVTVEGAGPGGEDQVSVFEIVGRGLG